MSKNKHIAVIGGGGSHGCDTVGKLLAMRPDYDTLIATSTGALMGGLVLLEQWDKLKNAYTSVNQKDIFNVNPFKPDGSLKKIHSAWRILRNKQTIGENIPLLRLIKKFFTIKDYNKIKALKKEFIVVVQEVSKNPTGNKKQYISIQDHNYNDFCLFIWASASVPVISSIVEINNRFYVDGGLTETVALKKAISLNPYLVHVFTHDFKPIEKLPFTEPFDGFAEYLVTLFKIQRNEIQTDDLEAGKLLNKTLSDPAKIEVYYLSSGVNFSKMVFNSNLMRKGVQMGYDSIINRL